MHISTPRARKVFHRLLLGAIAGGFISISEPTMAQEALAVSVADGEPWEMFVVKRRASNILVFRADGRGTISDGMASVAVGWRAVPLGICIKPEGQSQERCHQLTRTTDGIEASQQGRVVFILRR